MENPLVKYYEIDTTRLGKESREKRAARERALTAHGKERGMLQSVNLQHVMLLLPRGVWMEVADMEWGNDRVPSPGIPRRTNARDNSCSRVLWRPGMRVSVLAWTLIHPLKTRHRAGCHRRCTLAKSQDMGFNLFSAISIGQFIQRKY